MISTTGNVLETDILYIDYNKNVQIEPSKDLCAAKLKGYLLKHRLTYQIILILLLILIKMVKSNYKLLVLIKGFNYLC